MKFILVAFIFTFLIFAVPSFVDLKVEADQSALGNKPVQTGQNQPTTRQDPVILGFKRLGTSGIVFTRKAIFRTEDSGKTWAEIAIPMSGLESLVQVQFVDIETGLAMVTDPSARTLTLFETYDGGKSWGRQDLSLGLAEFPDADLNGASIENVGIGMERQLKIPVETSSNFRGWLTYLSDDRGRTWRFQSKIVELNTAEPDVGYEISADGWTLRTEGVCLGEKSGCFQQTRIYEGGREITPPAVMELAEATRDSAARSVGQKFAAGPEGTTRISLNRGFDMCNAPTAAQMLIWWNSSPLYDMNIYFSGRNRACKTQANLSLAWVDQVTAMGWGLIPTVVGYQSPCTASGTTVKLSYDPATAETQGRGEADIAVTDGGNLGLTTGSIFYYDMERYDPPTPDTLGCRAATVAFLKGWTERIRELGFKSGVYGSPKNAQEDWVGLGASKPDVIWMARWDNIPSVWTYTSFPSFPTNEWADHQRIKQWQAPHNETWGGVTFNIDGNIADAPVAGVAIARNMPADFDGDGRSDISVFRPTDGVWYVLSSKNSTFSGTQFGVAADVITPGDFDGDGKTDFCVFRPSTGTWYMLTKSGAFSARQFGADGDVPVPADYNGDGKTDIAVFRPSNGYWYIANSDSKGTFTFVQFGQLGDKPVQGDYDGDGRAEIAVFRPSGGAWYILRISDLTYYGVGFGVSTDQPAQGDFDGDGHTDLAVFRSGVWYLLQSSDGFSAISFGTAGDIPATGDYDGDGRSDEAVFRPSEGNWYVLRSQSGFTAAAFGQDGDRPVEAAYLPQ